MQTPSTKQDSDFPVQLPVSPSYQDLFPDHVPTREQRHAEAIQGHMQNGAGSQALFSPPPRLLEPNFSFIFYSLYFLMFC